MAKERKKMQHIHSSVADKQPKASILEPGELAVNNAAGKEFISTVNSDGEVVRFSSDGKMASIIEKKSVMPYSGSIITKPEDNKAQILIKLNQYASKDTPFFDEVNDATDMNDRPINPFDDESKTGGAGIAIDADEFALIGGNPTFNSVSADTIYRDNETYTYLSGDTIEKALEELADGLNNIPGIATSGDTVQVEEGGVVKTYIKFFDKNGIEISGLTIDADDFVKDGMVESAWTESVDNDTYLVIRWNNDADKPETRINIGDLFNVDEYYTKTEINGAFGEDFIPTAITSSVTEVIRENELVVSAALNDLNTRLIVVENRKDKYVSGGSVDSAGTINLDVANYQNVPIDGLADFVDSRVSSLSGDTNDFVTGGSVGSDGTITLDVKNQQPAYVSGLSQYISDATDGLFKEVEYITSSETIVFKDKDGDEVGSIDASRFVKDGMVLSVEVGIPTSGAHADQKCLIITWNNDASPEVNPLVTEIPLTDIFDPAILDGYYTKVEINNALGEDFIPSAITSSVTEVIRENELVTSAALNDLNTRVNEVSGKVENIDARVTVVEGNQITGGNFTNGELILNKVDGTSIPPITGIPSADTNTYVVSGESSNGNLTLTMNDGNAVTISGISAQDTYVSGGSVDGTTLKLKRNDGETVTIEGLPVPGEPVFFPDHYIISGKCENDTLILALGKSVSGGSPTHEDDIVITDVVSNDHYVISGEVKDTGIIELNNGTGTPAEVTGLAEYVNAHTASGGTYNATNHTLTINNGDGTSFDVSGFTDNEHYVISGEVKSDGSIELNNQTDTQAIVSGLATYIEKNDNYVLSGSVDSGSGIITLDMSVGSDAQITGLAEYVSSLTPSVNDVWVNESGDTMTGALNISGATTTDAMLNVTGVSNFNGAVNVSGDVTATGAMYSSDKRLKENIEVISSEDLENVKNIDFKEFNFISNKGSKKIGVIAQELQDNGLGKLTGTNDAGYLTVDYISLLCLKIAELEKEIKKLKGEK